MKRFLCGLAALCLLLFSQTIAYAEGYKTYQLNELELSISVPDDLVIFTRDIQANDPNLSKYGLTKEYMDSLMRTNSIYLNAWDPDMEYEIIVTMIGSSLGDFNSMSDTVLSSMAAGLADQYKGTGITYIKSDIYQHSQAKFLKIYISQPNGEATVYGLQYYTVFDGKAINITLQSYSGKIDSSKEKKIKSIVDNIVFETEPIQVAPPQHTPAFQYKDDKTGVRFTVPENWSKASFTGERDFLSAKFTSNLEEGLTILYGGYDMWGEMSASERSGLKRSDLDNTIFSKSDVADMLGLKASDISTVSYNGKEYFKAVATTSQETYGMNLSVTSTQLFRIENGYAYTFQFSATNTSPYYNDFEALLSTVEYPSSNTPAPINPVNPPATNKSSTGFLNSWLGLLIINLLLTIIIHPTPIWIYRYAIRKKPIAPKTAKKIVIIDAAVVVVLMIAITAITGGSKISFAAILLWSSVCYSSLTKGYVEDNALSAEDADKSPVVIDQVSMGAPFNGGAADTAEENEPKM